MADRPQSQINLDDLLKSFSAENAALTQRALIAEAGNAARDRTIDDLATRVVELEQALAAAEALLQPEPPAEPTVAADEDAEPTDDVPPFD